MEIKEVEDPSTVWNMNCSIREIATTYSPKATTAEIHYLTIRLRVQFVMCQVVRQSWWFQQGRSVRTAGPRSTQDIWFQNRIQCQDRVETENAAAIFVGTKHRKLLWGERDKTKRWSTLLKFIVDHYHVPHTSAEGSWPVSFALNDELLCTNNHVKFTYLYCCHVYLNRRRL